MATSGTQKETLLLLPLLGNLDKSQGQFHFLSSTQLPQEER
jgi:hypothetical protein